MDVQLDFSTVIDCYARGIICTGFMHYCMYVQTFYAECRVIFFCLYRSVTMSSTK